MSPPCPSLHLYSVVPLKLLPLPPREDPRPCRVFLIVLGDLLLSTMSDYDAGLGSYPWARRTSLDRFIPADLVLSARRNEFALRSLAFSLIGNSVKAPQRIARSVTLGLFNTSSLSDARRGRGRFFVIRPLKPVPPPPLRK